MSDLAHGFWNMAKNVLDLVTASGKMKLKPTRRDEEVARGRFTTMPKDAAKMPWVASSAAKDSLSNHLLALKVPTDWPANPDITNGGAGMKIAEGLALCGDRGQWIIGQLGIDIVYNNVLVDVLAGAGACLRKSLTETELKGAHSRLVDALAMAETKFPLQWCTITTHMLLHAADWVRFDHFFITFRNIFLVDGQMGIFLGVQHALC